MDKPRKVKDNVEWLLENYPTTINDDKRLLTKYWVKYVNDWQDIPFEALYRARRRLQIKFPSNEHIRKQKKRMEQEYVTTYTGGNG